MQGRRAAARRRGRGVSREHDHPRELPRLQGDRGGEGGEGGGRVVRALRQPRRHVRPDQQDRGRARRPAPARAHAQAGRHRQPRAARAAADDDGRRRGGVGGGRRAAVGRHRRGRARRGAALPGAGRAGRRDGRGARRVGRAGRRRALLDSIQDPRLRLTQAVQGGADGEALDDDVLAARDLHRLDGVDPQAAAREARDAEARAPRTPRNSAARNSGAQFAAIDRARARFSSDAPRRRCRRPPASRSASTRHSCTPARCRSRTG